MLKPYLPEEPHKADCGRALTAGIAAGSKKSVGACGFKTIGFMLLLVSGTGQGRNAE